MRYTIIYKYNDNGKKVYLLFRESLKGELEFIGENTERIPLFQAILDREGINLNQQIFEVSTFLQELIPRLMKDNIRVSSNTDKKRGLSKQEV